MSAELQTSVSGPIRILLVEDNHDDRRLLCDLLDAVRDVKFVIDWAESIVAGRDLLERDQFDVCLIDQDLPDGEGLELLDYAAIHEKIAPTILMSAHASTKLDQQAMALGASGFLDKGRLDPSLLERTIRYAINQGKAIQSLRQGILQDENTGLLKPALFCDRLTHAFALAKRQRKIVATVMIDVAQRSDVAADRETCEKHLARMTKHIQRCLREADTAGRMSDRRLALIFEGLRSADDAALITQKVLEDMSSPILIDGCSMSAKPKAGIALYPQDGDEADVILRRADAAMRQVKSEKNLRYRFACDHLHHGIHGRVQHVQDLQHALNQRKLALRYRPLIHTDSSKISLSTEVHAPSVGDDLILIDQPTLMAQAPSFIAMLTDWLIGNVVTQLRIWQEQGFKNVELSIPFLSACPSHLSFLEGAIQQHLQPAAIDPRRIEFDFSEDLVFEDIKNGGPALATLRAMGVRLALDGFGRDSASIHHLPNSHLDSLKLSPRLYDNLPGDKSQEALLKAIIGFGHDLNLRIVAEGTANERQFSFLKNIGCDAIKLSVACTSLTTDKFMNWLRGNIRQTISRKPKIAVRSSLQGNDAENLTATSQVNTRSYLSSLDGH